MGPTIILDKSALQALSKGEIGILGRYYNVNVPPVLLLEMMADLKKQVCTNTRARRPVSILAKKISLTSSTVSVHYKHLLAASLLKGEPPLDGRIPAPSGKIVQTEAGETGLVISESPEELALARWKDERFTEAEHLLATAWRESTRKIDLEATQREIRRHLGVVSGQTSIDSILQRVDEAMNARQRQEELMQFLFWEFGVPAYSAAEVRGRWVSEGEPLIDQLAPFAGHCVRATLLFYHALAAGLVGTRPTNRVDLEYLFYLPFCFVFTSNDIFHRTLAPALLRPDQFLVAGTELKADLAAIHSEWAALTDEEKRDWQYAGRPKDDPSSVTSRIWSTLFPGYTEEKAHNRAAAMSQADHERVMERMRGIQRASHADAPIKSLENLGFVARKIHIGPEDPCPCGSGLRFGDCHSDQARGK